MATLFRMLETIPISCYAAGMGEKLPLVRYRAANELDDLEVIIQPVCIVKHQERTRILVRKAIRLFDQFSSPSHQQA